LLVVTIHTEVLIQNILDSEETEETYRANDQSFKRFGRVYTIDTGALNAKQSSLTYHPVPTSVDITEKREGRREI
jgi:hypothetical protein